MADFRLSKAFLDRLTWGYYDFGAGTPSHTLRLMLLNDTYDPNDATYGIDKYWQVTFPATFQTNYEVTGAGYTALGKALTGINVSLDVPTGVLTVDADDVVWTNSTITARYGLLWSDASSNSLDVPIGLVDFGSNKTSTSGDFTVQWGASGIFTMTLT